MKKWYYNSWLLAAMFVVGSIGSIFILGLPILVTAIVFTALKGKYEKEFVSEDYKNYQIYIETNKTLDELNNLILNKKAFYDDFIVDPMSRTIKKRAF